MGELRHGYMIISVQELTIMLQANLAQQWPTVLTGQGCNDVLLMIQLKFLKILTIVGQLLELYIMFLFYCVHHKLFPCGTREGESYLVEWNENDGAIKRVYNGLWKRLWGLCNLIQCRTGS